MIIYMYLYIPEYIYMNTWIQLLHFASNQCEDNPVIYNYIYFNTDSCVSIIHNGSTYLSILVFSCLSIYLSILFIYT